MGAIVAPSSMQSASSATSHTITFNANGGSGVMAAQRIPTKGKKLPASKFVRDSRRYIGCSLTRIMLLFAGSMILILKRVRN
jgi:hypothetical protein